MFGRPTSAGPVGVYGCLEVIQKSIETVGEIDRQKIRDEMAKGPFATVVRRNPVRKSTSRESVGRWAMAERRGCRRVPFEQERRSAAAVPETRLEGISRHAQLRPAVKLGLSQRFHIGGAGLIAFEVVLNGILLGGMYGLIALGLNLQFGVARILNLSYGEFFMAGAIGAWFAVMSQNYNPLLSWIVTAPLAFAANWLIYQWLLLPLIKRAKNQHALDADVVLITFGLFFIFQGLAISNFGGDQRGYSFLSEPVHIFDATMALNRLVAFLGACALALILFGIFRYTRLGMALRAITIDPVAANIVGINVLSLSAFAFAAGGAMAVISGALVSTFISFSASIGVEYTLKALIVVILAGVGRITGTLAAGLLLGVVEAVGGYLVDPGLTLAINFALFVLVLLWRPTGLFSRA